VYFVDFNSARGSEQSGIRPAVVVSNNRSNYASPVITVIPITHTKSSRKYPQNIDLPAGIFDSIGGTILCGQIMAASRERIKRFLGKMPTDQMEQVSDALRKYLDI